VITARKELLKNFKDEDEEGDRIKINAVLLPYIE
jgi:hypothetical protein